jgi:ornithine--oxo-acid transaminase
VIHGFRTERLIIMAPPDKDSLRSEQLIALEEQHGAHNYQPLPVVLEKGDGVFVWDVEGHRYYDFLSAYSAVNQGHAHPRIVAALSEQAGKLALTSRAFYNSELGRFEAFATEYFGYDRILPMNTGAEAVETAIKLCRKWAYRVKGVPADRAKILVCENNFHGRTITLISFSSDPDARNDYGPYTPGFEVIPYNDLEALETALADDDVAGFLVEPIQGEAGVNVPADDYIRRAAELCRARNVLFMVDEIQTGIGRTGSLLAVCGDCSCAGHCERQASYVKPDVLMLGKALSGGVYPVSAVLADDEVMLTMEPGQHGSTYGGNPVAARVAMTALEVVRDEKLAANARHLGEIFRSELERIAAGSNLIARVRGKGLLNAIVINDTADSSTALELCLAMKENGLLAKPTHGNIVRFAPPLVMTESQLSECVGIIEEAVAAS